MVEKELGLAVDEDANAVRGALVMGGAFGVAALVPILPYLFFHVTTALWVSVILSGAMLFAMGALKSRWTHRHWLPSGLEIFALGAFAGIAGYFFRSEERRVGAAGRRGCEEPGGRHMLGTRR